MDILVVRGSGENEIKELSGIVYANHLRLNSVNQCRFIVHVSLDDENTRILVQLIKGSFVDYLQNDSLPLNNLISAVFLIQ